METIQLKRINETFNKVICDPGVAYELREHFTFDVPGAKFMPAYRNKMWDGKIRLFNHMACQLYGGLTIYLEKFCRDRGYELEFIDNFAAENFSLVDAQDEAIKFNLTMEPRDYQLSAFAHAVRNRRTILLSPTGSGKSLIIYLLLRHYNLKTLIIVPTTSLVSQLATDFRDYGFDAEEDVHKIYAGESKQTDKWVTISTWQSVYKLDKSFFGQYDLVIGDEVHLFTAKSLQSIMAKLDHCKYRFGLTGTLDGTKTHRFVLEGLFGPVKKVTTTAELIDNKHLSNFRIKAILLQYPDTVRHILSNADYQTEMDWLVKCASRNTFIKNLALSLKGNTLLLFQYVEKHGKVLYDDLSKTGRKVFYVAGSVDGQDREEIRKLVESEDNCIIVASYGTFSTGVNIKRLHNIIFGSPSKSRVRNLQSIGRALRTAEDKDMATLYDIADDLTWKKKQNTTLKHFAERIKIYIGEQFKYKTYTVKIEV